MAATSQQSSQQMMSDWFQKAAEMTEAAMMATARMQLATLDRFMESMTGARSMLETAPIEPQQWFPGFGGKELEEGTERKSRERGATAERAQPRGQEPGHKKPAAKRKAPSHAKRSRPHKRR